MDRTQKTANTMGDRLDDVHQRMVQQNPNHPLTQKVGRKVQKTQGDSVNGAQVATNHYNDPNASRDDLVRDRKVVQGNLDNAIRRLGKAQNYERNLPPPRPQNAPPNLPPNYPPPPPPGGNGGGGNPNPGWNRKAPTQGLNRGPLRLLYTEDDEDEMDYDQDVDFDDEE